MHTTRQRHRLKRRASNNPRPITRRLFDPAHPGCDVVIARSNLSCSGAVNIHSLLAMRFRGTPFAVVLAGAWCDSALSPAQISSDFQRVP